MIVQLDGNFVRILVDEELAFDEEFESRQTAIKWYDKLVSTCSYLGDVDEENDLEMK